jgi:hypothetical protein
MHYLTLKLLGVEKFTIVNLISILVADYKINADGSHTIFARFMRKGVLTINAIFPETVEIATRYIKRRKGFKGALQHVYKVHSNADLTRLVFATFLRKLLIRVADGGMYMFPGRTKAHMVLKSMSIEDVKRLRQLGKYRDYDIIRADFKIPQFFVDFGPYARQWDFEVIVPKEIQNRAFRNAENRQIPWLVIPKTLDRDVRYDRCDEGDL